MSILAATSSLATTKRSRRGRIKLKSFQRGLMVAFFFYSDEETPGKEAAWNFLETWPECQRRSSTERYRFACAFPTSLPTWPLIDKNSNGIVLRYSSNFPPIFSWNQNHIENIPNAFWRVFFPAKPKYFQDSIVRNSFSLANFCVVFETQSVLLRMNSFGDAAMFLPLLFGILASKFCKVKAQWISLSLFSELLLQAVKTEKRNALEGITPNGCCWHTTTCCCILHSISTQIMQSTREFWS